MMAVRSPIASPHGPVSSFSPYSEASASPRFQNSPLRRSITNSEGSEKGHHLAAPGSGTPTSTHEGLDPSPVAPSSNGTEFSNGTDFADLEDTSSSQGDTDQEKAKNELDQSRPQAAQPELALNTRASSSSSKSRSDEDDPPQSVIHAPSGFNQFISAPADESVKESGRPATSPSPKSDVTVKSPLETKQAEKAPNTLNTQNNPNSPPPLTTTSLTPPKDWSERATPRAQTRNDFDALDQQRPRSSLENIPEGEDGTPMAQDADSIVDTTSKVIGRFQDTEEEVNALRTALAECWTLCNTLASLSYIHRERLFNFSGKGDMQEQAWKSCWRLCQKLYESRDDDTTAHVRPTLDLCRDFCQSLFEVRVRDNDVSDSVLRVSFELNNHLYNTHDRSLPEAFRERTLDFYITLCHRLMKQKTNAVETDSLLKACWSLAEMLFSLRQNKREGKKPTEELLGSAVQACWELCDLFREGWTQIRPDRGTPRPSQTTFTQDYLQAKRSGFSSDDNGVIHRGFPETPTTIFEDTINISPDEAPVPNILVLGGTSNEQSSSRKRWSSASSTLSTSTRSSELTGSSAHTVTTPAEDLNLTLLKLLFIKAAMNAGFQRSGPQNLQAFTKAMPQGSFGTQNWQMTVLENVKKVISTDPAFRSIGPPMQAGAIDVARAVQTMAQNGYYSWLEDLFLLVFGFRIDAAPQKRNVGIQT